jgi:DNA-binding transcriptional MocR family regulator
MVTNWRPDLQRRRGPRYRAIAEALAEDIAEGVLPAGTRLPTHRDLAWRLKVTVGTVSRAYAEAERRGLIAGEVGRGTYVRAPAVPAGLRLEREPRSADYVDLDINRPRAPEEAALFAETLVKLARSNDAGELMEYQPHAGTAAAREAGALWIARSSGLATSAGQVVVTCGGQHAMAVILGAVLEPGDGLAVESLTYPGICAAAKLFHVNLVPLALDEQGAVPDSFAAACRSGRVRAAYLLPTLQNPTTAMMPVERRRAFAELAQRYGVILIEDDVYGFLRAEPLPPLATFAPEHAFYFTSASKSLVPGLRVGYVHCPTALVDRAVAAIRSTTYTAPPLTARIASQWIGDGTADALIAEKRAETARRQRILRRVLAGHDFRTTAGCAHVWLVLPPAWRAEDFAAAAHRRGVGVATAAAFAAGREIPNALRLSIGTPATAADLERGLVRLNELLTALPTPYLSVV